MLPILVSALLSFTPVPHAIFQGNDAKALFKSYLPSLVANRIINKEFNGHLSKVISLLKQENAFMICSTDNTSAFVCSDHGSTHIVEAVIFEKGENAFPNMEGWHDVRFPDVTLDLA